MSLRTEKVASLIKQEISSYISRELQSPQYGFITVTDVLMSADLALAKIYISILGNTELKIKTMKMLENNKSLIRAYIGSHVRLKFTPSIKFFIDDTLDRVERINELIKQIHKDDNLTQS